VKTGLDIIPLHRNPIREKLLHRNPKRVTNRKQMVACGKG